MLQAIKSSDSYVNRKYTEAQKNNKAIKAIILINYQQDIMNLMTRRKCDLENKCLYLHR